MLSFEILAGFSAVWHSVFKASFKYVHCVIFLCYFIGGNLARLVAPGADMAELQPLTVSSDTLTVGQRSLQQPAELTADDKSISGCGSVVLDCPIGTVGTVECRAGWSDF